MLNSTRGMTRALSQLAALPSHTDAAPYTRRDFLKVSTAATLAVLVSACSDTDVLESILEAIRTRPVRKDVAGLSASDPVLVAYADAIKKMKALPSTDMRSWENQAKIHQGNCPHGNWLFLPWHRVYLLFFEQICRELSGMQDFGLPYWNWTTTRGLPAPFLDTTSELHYPHRRSNISLPDSIVGGTILQTILNEKNFSNFASGAITLSDDQRKTSRFDQLEGTPHNSVHGRVGNGGPGGTQGDRSMSGYLSPLDPIFWLHHCYIDCLWAHWNIDLGNANTNATAWSSRDFTEFVDGKGVSQTVRVGLTPVYPLLSYRYEATTKGQARSGGGEPGTESEANATKAFLEEGAPAGAEVVEEVRIDGPGPILPGETVTLPIEGVERERIARAAESPSERVVLDLDVVLEAPGTIEGLVFLDDFAEPTDDFVNSVTYLGTIGFFVADEPNSEFCPIPGRLSTYRFTADAAVTAQADREVLAVTLVAQPLAENAPDLIVESIFARVLVVE